MTHEKARDFFSAYHEGTLEAGLCVSLEQKLKLDSDLRHEYDSFVRTIGELDALKFEEIEIPSDLHEHISARLDLHIHERKRNAAPSWALWLRGLSFAGVATLAILGAILAINFRNDHVTLQGPFPVSAKDQMSYSVSKEGITLRYAPTSIKTVAITNEGKELSRTTVGDSTTPELKTLLTNSLQGASVFAIQIDGQSDQAFVALPGGTRSSVNKGDGTVVDLVKAVSDYFRVPVTLETHVPGDRKGWMFTTTDAVTETSKALGPDYGVTLLHDGRLEIEQK